MKKIKLISSNFTPTVEKPKLILPTAENSGESATATVHLLYRFFWCHKAVSTSVHLHLLVNIAFSQH